VKADPKVVKKYLNLVKGQVEGILRMVEDDRYCIDISNQLLASIALLKKANQIVLKAHLDSCVKNNLSEEGQKKIDEIIVIMNKLNQ